MKVFSLFFKILRHNRVGILLYLVSFAVIFMLISSGVRQGKGGSELDTAELIIQVNDHDQTELSRHLKDYLLKGARLPEKECAEDEVAIQDALYTHALDYMLVIPEGFTESLRTDERELKLRTYPSSMEALATSVDMKIISYVQNWDQIARTFGGYPDESEMPRALALLDQVLSGEVEISSYTGNGSDSEKEQLIGLSYYLSYLCYIITSVCFLIVGKSLVSIEDPERKKRDVVSGFSEERRTIQLFLASYLTVICVWILMAILSFFLVGWHVLTLKAAPLMLCSSLLHMLSIVSLSLLLCHLFPSNGAVSFLSNLVGLFLAFSSGIFVPAEFLWEPFHKASSLFPTYWDVQNQKRLMEDILAGRSLSYFYRSLLIMLGMGLLYFCLTLIYRRYKSGDIPA